MIEFTDETRFSEFAMTCLAEYSVLSRAIFMARVAMDTRENADGVFDFEGAAFEYKMIEVADVYLNGTPLKSTILNYGPTSLHEISQNVLPPDGPYFASVPPKSIKVYPSPSTSDLIENSYVTGWIVHPETLITNDPLLLPVFDQMMAVKYACAMLLQSSKDEESRNYCKELLDQVGPAIQRRKLESESQYHSTLIRGRVKDRKKRRVLV